MRPGGRRMPSVRCRRVCVIAVAVLSLLTSCKSGGIEDDPILRLSAEEALAEGKALMEAKKYLRAGEYLTHAFEVAPNSATGREALMLAADSLYLAGGASNLIKAEAKYRDFLNRFPTSERGAYAQLQLANSLSRRVLKPDRDQTITRQAVDAFLDVIRLYPGSEDTEEAQLQIQQLRLTLAEHEFLVGYHNYRRRLDIGAVARFEALLEGYQEYSKRDHALYLLGMSYLRMGEVEKGTAALERLRNEYPDSEFIEKLPDQED